MQFRTMPCFQDLVIAPIVYVGPCVVPVQYLSIETALGYDTIILSPRIISNIEGVSVK